MNFLFTSKLLLCSFFSDIKTNNHATVKKHCRNEMEHHLVGDLHISQYDVTSTEGFLFHEKSHVVLSIITQL